MLFWTFEILENVRVPFFKIPQKWGFENASLCPVRFLSKTCKKCVWKIMIFEQLPKSKIPLLAIHKIISHKWEDRSRKVNNGEPDLRFVHGNFWPVISRTVRKPCFLTSIPRGPNLCILGPPTWARLGPTHLGATGPVFCQGRPRGHGMSTWSARPAVWSLVPHFWHAFK